MSPVVEFRTGVDDKIAYAVRWLRVASTRRACVRVIGPAEALKLLDRALWVDDPQDFVAHAWSGDARRVPGLARTGIWLGGGEVGPSIPTLLLNLGSDIPIELAGIDRIVELVSQTPEDALAGRQRWKAYQQLGLSPAHRAAES